MTNPSDSTPAFRYTPQLANQIEQAWQQYWTDNGTTYNLYYDDMLEGGSETKVYSYDADAQTGTWVDPKYRIVNFTSEDVQYVPANFYNYVIANTTKLTQLSTPQNVTANGTVVSWDEVENATSYDLIEGGNNVLGTYTPTTTVELSLTEENIDYRDYLRIYDGNIDSGSATLLYEKTGSSGNAVSPQDLTITTGVLSIVGRGDSVAMNVLSTSGDVKLQSPLSIRAIFDVAGQCVISLRINDSI